MPSQCHVDFLPVPQLGDAQGQGSTNSTPKHRIAKGRAPAGSALAWEEEGVVTISVTKSSSGATTDKPNGSPKPGVHNSRKHGLNPPDTGSQTPSPSTSPKLKRKAPLPIAVRPPAIDNSPLLASSPHKVGAPGWADLLLLQMFSGNL